MRDVVGVHLAVRDGEALGDLVDDRLVDELRADVVPHLGVGEVLLLQLLAVLGLAALEVPLLDAREAIRDLLVGHLDALGRGALGALGLLDEQRNGLALDRRELGRPLLGERLAEAALRLCEQRVVVGLADVRLPDDGDVLAVEPGGAAATARYEHGQKQNGKDELEEGPHKKIAG